jgi:LysM repeat protein
MIVTIPLSVHAGILATVLDLFESEPIIYVEPTQYDNANQAKLLSSRTNVDPKAALGGGDILVDEGTLLPSAPFGPDDYTDKLSSNGEISVYTVREGDSLSEVAQMFGVTANTILWANDLPKATAIKPGDELVILPIVGVRHLVKTGDTISTIAKKYQSDAAEILSYNQLASSDALVVGDTLIIPGGNMHEATPKKIATAKPTKSTGSAGASGASGNFIHPVPGATRTQGIHGYNGVDLASAIGTPIRAAASGEVIVSKSSGWNGGYGNYVVIKHSNGTQTLYAHTSSNTVGVGAVVEAGETIAYVGNSGRSTGAHLHFEVRGASNPF